MQGSGGFGRRTRHGRVKRSAGRVSQQRTREDAMALASSDIPRPTLGTVATALAFVGVFLVLEWLSFIHDYKGLPVTPWNPGIGVAFALLLLGGPGFGPVLFAGIVIAEMAILRSPLPTLMVFGIAAMISVSYTAVAHVSRQRLQLNTELRHLSDIIVVLAAGAFGAGLVTLLLAGTLVATGFLGQDEVASAAGAFLVGDAIGIAVTTPLVLRLFTEWPHVTWRKVLAYLPEAAVLGACVAAAFWFIADTERADSVKFFYLLFVPATVAAIRHGLDGACLSLFVIQVGLVGLLHGQGFGAAIFTDFQILMLALTTTGLIVGVTVDERRAAERAVRASEAEVARAARFSLVSGMASALAHEINQPMAAARAYARSARELLSGAKTDTARAEGNIAAAVTEIDHASAIVRRMREFLRRGRPHVSTIDMPRLIDDVLSLAGADIAARRIHVDAQIDAALPRVFGDRIQLQQVLLNLLRNASESIGTHRRDGEIGLIAQVPEGARHIEIRVRDNGHGIAPELAERLFQPLASSKEEGLGLGLAISRAIVEAHGGRIWLASGAPGATEFHLTLPLEQKIDT
jgi:two-component system sensor kinase FixL